MIHLDLRNDLSKVDPTKLTPGRCLYTAPCAIGAMMTPEQRRSVPDSTGIYGLLDDGIVQAPEDQWADLNFLQKAFDMGDGFETALSQLKEKYA